jgi:hypothetical protein
MEAVAEPEEIKMMVCTRCWLYRNVESVPEPAYAWTPGALATVKREGRRVYVTLHKRGCRVLAEALW